VVFGLLLSFIVAWTLVFLVIGPTEVVDLIGVRNGYIALFLVALFGGVSTFTFSTYVGTLLVLAASGLDPLLLGLVSGAGVTFGDTVYYYLGRKGRMFLDGGVFSRFVKRATDWLHHKPAWVAVVGTYVYAAFTPLPNDVLAIALGATRRPYFHVILPLVFGNMTHTFIIASLGRELFT